MTAKKPIDIHKALTLLDQELKKAKIKTELTICGGAALILMGTTLRGTTDVDVLAKKIPEAVLAAAKVVAKKLKSPETWLNNQVNSLIERLPKDWEDHLVTVYTGQAITVRSISRQDMINAKLHAAIDRRAADFDDLIHLKPSSVEIENARVYCLKQTPTETYEVWVNGYVKLLKKELNLI
jgi:hypothetical protein